MEKNISNKLVRHIYELSKLKLDNNEVEEIKTGMEKMLNYFSVLDELDTKEVEVLEDTLPQENPYRDDTASGTDGRKDSLQGAPQRVEDFFAVPKTIK